MNYSLNIQAEDFPFVIEAIKLRTLSLINSLEMQVRDIQQAREAIAKAAATPVTTTEIVKEAIEKKVIPQKAPYGHKKNGQPKKRIGRPRKV